MDARELRIGNYVYNRHGDLHEIGYNCFNKFAHPTMDGNPSGFAPIPLTEEWLTRFGFDKINHITEGVLYKKDWLRISASLNPEWRGAPIKRDAVQYVHQLQNLYFALTGAELELKDET